MGKSSQYYSESVREYMNKKLDPREEAVKSFYKTILGREYDEPGLKFYVNADSPLEMVYMTIYTSQEAEDYRRAQVEEWRKKKEEEYTREEEERKKEENIILPLTLAIFVKDAEDSIAMVINSMKPIVSEVVVLDTGSRDNTISICKEFGARVYEVGFSDFGSIRTVASHLAREKFIFMLDSDETVLAEDLPLFKTLLKKMENEDIDIVGLPRKRWLDLDMTEQLEKDVYPDWQFRLFKNDVNIRYKRRVHEIICGSDKRYEDLGGPVIQHFQDVFKRGEKLASRNELYKELQKLDIEEGIEHEEKAVQEIDEVI